MSGGQGTLVGSFGQDRTTSYPAHASVPHLRQAGEDAFARDKGDMMQFTTNARRLVTGGVAAGTFALLST